VNVLVRLFIVLLLTGPVGCGGVDDLDLGSYDFGCETAAECPAGWTCSSDHECVAPSGEGEGEGGVEGEGEGGVEGEGEGGVEGEGEGGVEGEGEEGEGEEGEGEGEPDAPTVGFVSPVDGASLGDADETAFDEGDPTHAYLIDGFHVRVELATTNVADGARVELFVDEERSGEASVEQGRAVFEAVELPERVDPPVLLRAVASVEAEPPAAAALRLSVAPGSCGLGVEPLPNPDGCHLDAADPDVGGTLDGEPTTLVVATNCAQVTLGVNDGPAEARPTEDRRARFEIRLLQVDAGSPANQVFVAGQGNAGQESALDPLVYVVDTLPPAPTLDALGAGGVLKWADDVDDASDGLQVLLAGSVCFAEPGSAVVVGLETADDQPIGPSLETSVAEELDPDGCHRWTAGAASIDESGDLMVVVTAQDGCGNAGSGRFPVVVDLSQPTLEIVEPESDRLFTRADDTNEDWEDGLNTRVVVEACDLQPGEEVLVEAGPAAEGPFDGVSLEPGGFPPVDSHCERVPVRVGLGEGVHYLRARYDGRNPALSEPVRVTVVGEQPEISLVDLAQGARLAEARLMVCASTVRVENGQLATLWIDGERRAEAAVHEGQVCFAPLELRDDSYRLQARVQDAAGQTAESPEVLVFVDTIPPAIEAVRPANGATLTGEDDEDGDPSNGLQLTVEVSVLDDDPELEVCLSIDDGDPSCLRARREVDLLVSIGAGGHALHLEVRDRAGNASTADVEFSVELEEPYVRIQRPGDGVCLAEGREVEVVAETNLPDGNAAGLRVDGERLAEGVVEEGVVSFAVDLEMDRWSELVAEVHSAGGAAFSSAAVRVQVKSIPPLLGFVYPEPDGV